MATSSSLTKILTCDTISVNIQIDISVIISMPCLVNASDKGNWRYVGFQKIPRTVQHCSDASY